MIAAYIILVLVALQRLSELVIARRNTSALKASGWREVGAAHYPLIVGFHALWLIGLFLLAPRAEINGWFVAAYVVLQGLRVWILATLGRRWTTRVMVKPGETLVAAGPYKYLNHPNYTVVAAEIFVLPLAFGFYLYALVAGLINLALLAYRIRIENAALRDGYIRDMQGQKSQ